MTDIVIPTKFFVHVKRPPGLVLDPMPWGTLSKVTGKVVAAVYRDGILQDVHETTNIVTDAGDLYHAQRVVQTAVPTNFTDGVGVFDGVFELYTEPGAAPSKSGIRSDLSGGTPVVVTGSATGKAMDSGYPKVNDTDSANTGKGADVVTYRATYTNSEIISATAITDLVITNPGLATGDALLMWADGVGITAKSASDQVVLYANHTFTGTSS